MNVLTQRWILIIVVCGAQALEHEHVDCFIASGRVKDQRNSAKCPRKAVDRDDFHDRAQSHTEDLYSKSPLDTFILNVQMIGACVAALSMLTVVEGKRRRRKQRPMLHAAEQHTIEPVHSSLPTFCREARSGLSAKPANWGDSGKALLRVSASAAAPARAEATARFQQHKFVQLDGPNASPGLVPVRGGQFAVVVGGWTRQNAEAVLQQALSHSTSASETWVPMNTLKQSELDKPLCEVLAKAATKETCGAEAVCTQPFVLFSGWDPEKMFMAANLLQDMLLPHRQALYIVAAPKDMAKSMAEILEHGSHHL
eukprot:CAMPEP_0115559516 /NCGR_PEP_ID=MMETSP0271-20121206/99995_1 /TAXON_ID=71861 /ORGANISM="Scrippsiella trochoidea, Strain CCMP3099" /LENGTH=311 /DNA_ID=CAMNT_0002993567 /DNA_START=29 /DNA_END=965 /DNA_ORIENTATION=-